LADRRVSDGQGDGQSGNPRYQDAHERMQAPQARRSEAQARHARASAQPTESADRASGGAFGNRRGGFAGKRDQHRARKQEKAAAKEAKREEKRRAKEAGEPGAVRRFINAWADRLLGAAKDGGLSKQEAEYAGHRTTADYIWNTAGLGAFGMVFPLLTIVVTQLCGAEQAGRFSLAFVAGQLLIIIANYGIRTYQVSDVKEVRSFTEYQVNRWITCIAMLLIGYIYCCIRGYSGEMFTMFMWVFVYRMVDGLADVYEGRLQQMDKLYLAGISQTARSLLAFLTCTIVLFLTHDLGIASIAMGIAAILSFVVITFPLALLETPKSRRMSIGGVIRLFKDGFPVFLALFLYAFIDNMPKFVMEGVLTYDNQLYFNALYFPAQAILMTVGFIYKPMLVRIANAWADPSRRRRFDLFVFAMVLLIAAITAIGILLMGWIGIPIMSFLYGLDFEQFRTMSYIMLVAGGITGVIDFLYQVITVMRHQRDVMRLYIVTFGFSLFVPYLMVHTAGLNGAIDGYLIVMAILMALLVMEYITVRLNYSKNPKKNPEYMAGSPIEAKEMHRMHRGEMARTAPHRRTANAAGAQQGQAPMQQAPASQPVRQQAAAPQAPAQPAPQCPVSQAPARIPPVPKSAQAAPDPFDDDDYDGEGESSQTRD
jgi:O-antigen/teichoic acid export membrane protein